MKICQKTMKHDVSLHRPSLRKGVEKNSALNGGLFFFFRAFSGLNFFFRLLEASNKIRNTNWRVRTTPNRLLTLPPIMEVENGVLKDV